MSAEAITLPIRDLAIELRNQPAYSFGSTDNAFRPQREFVFGERFVLSSRHAVLCHRGDQLLGSAMLGATGGASGVHDRSMLLTSDRALVAVGPFVVALKIPTLELDWSCQADRATCFGLHFTPDQCSIISHGELEVARLSLSGEILWQSGGADIFTGDMAVTATEVHVQDFNGRAYAFNLETGHG